MHGSRSHRAVDARTWWIVPPLVVLAALHLFALARNHNEGEDSAHYMMDVTLGQPLFHPNHLAFSAVNWVHYRIWEALGYTGNARIPMQVLSAAAGVASIYLIYRIALRVGITPAMALAAAGWTAFSFGFWVYSLEGDTYLLPIPFMLVSLLLLFGVVPVGWRALTAPVVARLVVLAVIGAAATVLHQQYVFLVPIVALTMILMWQTSPDRTASSLITTVGIYVGTAAVLVIAAYLWVGMGIYGQHTVFETLGWARGLATHGLWESFTLKTPLLMLVGFSRSIFGINFLFHPSYTADKLSAAFPNKALVEERYLATHSIGTVTFALIVIAMTVAVVAIVWLAYRLIRDKGPEATARPFEPRWIFTRFAVLYLVVFSLLNMIWEPDNPEFWIALLPVVALLLASRLNPGKAVIPASLALVAALFVANFFGAVWPYSRVDSDYWALQNEGFASVVGKGDLIVSACPYICQGNLAFFTDRRPLEASSDDVNTLVSALASPQTGRVFVSSWAFHPPGPGLGDEDTDGSGKVRAMLESLRGRMVEVGRSGPQVIYEIKPAP